MGNDDGGSITDPLNKKGGWKTVRINVLGTETAAGSNGEGVKSNGEDDKVDGSLEVKKSLMKTLKYLNAFSKQQPATTHGLKGLKFISKNDDVALDARFDELAGENDGLLHRSRFGECIGMNKDSQDFAEDLFDSLCRRRNITGDSINKEQFKEFRAEIANQSFDSRLRIFLDMVDKDKDGKITEDELREIIKVSASANKLSSIKNHATKYAALVMEELDTNNLGYIMIDKLEKLLKDAATLNEREEKQLLSESSRQQQKLAQSPIRRRYEDLKYFIHDNWKRCWVIVLWIGTMVGLFTWKYIQYKNRVVYDVLGSCVCIAKGSAETLKLNMAIMLLPVCRNTITWLRNKTKLGAAIPFDDNINFHQVIAVAIAIGVGLHAITHLTCDFPRLIHATEEEYKPLQKYFGDQAKNYWHFVKEVEGYTGIIMLVLMTIAFTLAWLRQGKLKPPSVFKKLTRFNAFKNSKLYGAFVTKLTSFYAFLNKVTGFNLFWYSHHLFVIVYALLIVHGIKLYLTKEWYKKTTWMYLAVPILLYACERLVRTFRSRVDPARILKVTSYPGGVLALRMTKPQGFEYKSGEYMFVKCVAVSPFECIPKVLIDGPYGAPAQDYKNYEVVLLVGLGIGATPMISIVKDIVNNMKEKEAKENAIEDGATLLKNRPSPTSATSANDFKTKKAYFYWVTKEQDSFDWFESVMNEVAEIDKNRVIEMHNYCTSVYEEGDARSALITMLQSLNHTKNGVDVVSGTRVKSHFAKPVWEDVYNRIAAKHTDSEIGVFYCGTPVLIKELKQLAANLSQDESTSTQFVFHKENF
ncbi:hypothetical protein SSX86_010241 [Deinandra increscens subsp. villosa]|uniref:EF-hand domain-containing protein n=1 Tax=Deinandra increscens subsp. villosa TaxID=3103831 RepID=A0AAP0DBG3_9ASTR